MTAVPVTREHRQPCGRAAENRSAHRNGDCAVRVGAPADRQGRHAHRVPVDRYHAASAATEPQLPVADQSRPRRDTRPAAEQRSRHARPRPHDERNGLDRNTNGTKTDGATNVNIWLPHHTMYVSPAENDRHGECEHEQLRRRAGQRRRRGDHGHHQVRHQRVQRLGVRVLQQPELQRAALFRYREAGCELAYRWRDGRRPNPQEQVVLLRRVGRPVSADAAAVLFQRPAGGAEGWRLQPGLQSRTAAFRSSTIRRRAIRTAPAVRRSRTTWSLRRDSAKSLNKSRPCP